MVGVINKPDIPKLFINVYGDVWEIWLFSQGTLYHTGFPPPALQRCAGRPVVCRVVPAHLFPTATGKSGNLSVVWASALAEGAAGMGSVFSESSWKLHFAA